MLKSLGASVAQMTSRLSDARVAGPRGPGAWDREYDAGAHRRERRRQLKSVVFLALAFIAMVVLFSSLFHFLMEREGRAYSWATSVYWTLTTMTTLGFGDITFESDAGRLFSVVVLLSGSTFLLVMLPFVFIQFVFLPWMAERDRRRAPRSVPVSMRDHLVLTHLGPVEQALIERCAQAEVPYVLLLSDPAEAARLHDEEYSVMVGALDDPETYLRAGVERAQMVAATENDRANTNIAFTVREILDARPSSADNPTTTIVATANSVASLDILEIAGADHIVQLGEILGRAMADRTLGPDGKSHVIGEFAGLQIAEAGVAGTGLAGRTLADAQLRARLGVGIIGVWDRGRFEVATGATVLRPTTVLLLAATPDQLRAYDDEYSIESPNALHTIIVGGGRVGRAVARRLSAQELSCTIVEQFGDRQRANVPYVIGDAADLAVLEAAGLSETGAFHITTHDDDVNVYLTRYCRGLRPDSRIVARSRLDRNVSTLYRAGADAVLSYAGTCSAAIWNHFRGDETLLVAQGLNLFKTPIPRELVGVTLANAHLHSRTGCNVVAIEYEDRVAGNPDAHAPLEADCELILIGTEEAEAEFSRVFRHARRRVRRAGATGQTGGR